MNLILLMTALIWPSEELLHIDWRGSRFLVFNPRKLSNLKIARLIVDEDAVTNARVIEHISRRPVHHDHLQDIPLDMRSPRLRPQIPDRDTFEISLGQMLIVGTINV
ncbi:hypothetical protein HLH26_11780 [Gluconacetobacter sp. 1b LMG 1731]|uniref:Uncharacterized protein n=1 Tax=Gluconacetobacter dulcium TaxID=2729096 RepID=A0A7W4ILU6_9PROT|nr:hypothetical protein [Gluconacetobacter dulcium]MBB2165202.1 hypothetical protein [Gluconacetobacter dulcium]MBB2194389.1 hypothetical protein [Gluconacetobacter dulcium]